MSSPHISSSTNQNSDPSAQLAQSDSQQISSDDSGDASANSQSQHSSEESQTSPEMQKNLSHPPRKVIVYSRRHILHLSSSPLVQRPEGMPALKDWFGDWSEQHSNSQTKKDTSDSNNASGNRRFPRREQEEGETTRSTFRSTLSQPSQMGNFRHQSIRGDLTRSGDRDRDRDTDRDKEGHERLRSLSDMYDRERFGIPSTMAPLMRSQARDSSGHHPSSSISGTGTSGRLAGRERIDRDRDKDSTRRNETREQTRRKGGESVDWRRGPDASRKDEREGERDRSPEVDRSRRERSTSRDRYPERREDNRRGDDRDKETDKVRSREEDRKFKSKDSESHTVSGASNRWTEEKRRSRDEADKDTKEERRDRDRREKAREHPDTKRDRELREGWTIGEERTSSTRRTPGRGSERRTSAADEDKDIRKERGKDKEPAWMDDYIPEAGAPKAGIFGGKVEGIDDEIQAWKKKQASAKQQTIAIPSTAAPTVPPVSNGVVSSSASSESLPRDGTVLTTELIPPNPPSLTTDEQAKASDAFFFGLMKGDGKTKSHSTTPAKSPEPEITSANRSPVSMAPLSLTSSSTVDPARVDPAVISVATQGATKANNSPVIIPLSGSTSLPHSHDTLQTIHRSSPGPSLPAFTSSTPGPIGSSALNNDDPSYKIPPATTPPAAVSFNPPAQSRLLALAQSSHRSNNIHSPSGQHPISPAGIIGSQPSPKPFPPSRGQPSPLVPDPTSRGSSSGLGDSAAQRYQAFENIGVRSNFSPFDVTSGAESGGSGGGIGAFTSSRQSSVDLRSGFNAVDALLPDRNPRSSPQTLLASGAAGQTGTHDSTPSPSSSNYPSGRGSRFAKFWDKNKDAAVIGGPNAIGVDGYPSTARGAGMISQQGVSAPPQSASPSVSQQGRQHDLGPSNINGFPGNASMDNIQDMLAMLQNSQGARITPQGLLHRPSIPSHLHTLHEQQIPHHQPQPQHHFTNANNLLDHQFDNRSSFVPDGLVPGLRPARNRDGSIYTSDGMDEATSNPSPFSLSVQPGRGQSQQQQQFDRQTSGVGGLPQLYNSQNVGMSGGGGGGGGNNNGRMFQPTFRADPSLLNPGGPTALQRLPPGLANLGGRPPHDPNAYLNGSVVGGLGLGMGLAGGMQGPVVPGNAVGGGGGPQHQHQPFNGFGGNASPANNFGIGGGMGGMSVIGGMNLGGGAGLGGAPGGGQRTGGPSGQLPLQGLLNSGGNAMISSTAHHPDFTVQHQPHHHHHHPGPGVRGPPPLHQQPPHGQLSLGGGGGPPPSGIPGGARGAFVQSGVSGPVPAGLPPLQAQLASLRPQQQQQHMLPGMMPPPQMQHLGPQQPGAMHGLHHGHGHGHGQSQNEHLLSMLMGGLVPRE